MVVDWVEGKKGGVGQHNSPMNREMADSSSHSCFCRFAASANRDNCCVACITKLKDYTPKLFIGGFWFVHLEKTINLKNYLDAIESHIANKLKL